MAWVLERGLVSDTRGGTCARDVIVDGTRVGARAGRRARAIDLAGRRVLPGFVNGHDHLGFASFPPLGRPPYGSVYAWAEDVRAGQGDARAAAALVVGLRERLLLGGLRNLLAGVTAVVHHDDWHTALARSGVGVWRSRLGAWWSGDASPRPTFPVRVLQRYAHAHSPGLTRALAATRPRSPRVPWLLHAAEGTDARAAGEIAALAAAGVLAPNTVLAHAVAATAGDAATLAASRASVVWCPESNLHLYGATAPIAALRAAGVRLGLGSDSPLSGARDALSNLATARRDAWLDDAELLRLATHDTAALFGLPVGGCEPGDVADIVVVDDLERLLDGDRRAVQLVVVAGRALYGAPDLMDALEVSAWRVTVDGAERRLTADLAAFLKRVLATHTSLACVPWLADVRVA